MQGILERVKNNKIQFKISFLLVTYHILNL